MKFIRRRGEKKKKRRARQETRRYTEYWNIGRASGGDSFFGPWRPFSGTRRCSDSSGELPRPNELHPRAAILLKMRGRGLPEGWPRPTKVAPFFDWRVPGPFVQPRATICPLPSPRAPFVLHLSSPAILKEQTRRTRARRKRAPLWPTWSACLPIIHSHVYSLVSAVQQQFWPNDRSSNWQFFLEN